jgi:hypothetical protein
MKAFGLVVLALTGGGCGLLPAPYLQTLPSKPLQRVTVDDLGTSEPVDADVTFVATHWENWLEPIPARGDLTAVATPRTAECGVFTMRAVKVRKGVYCFQPEHRWSSATLWLPLPPVLGCWLHNCYDGRVCVTAPGYGGVWIGNAMSAKEMGQDTRQGMRGRVTFEHDGIHVSLPRLRHVTE